MKPLKGWEAYAACLGMNPNIFFTDSSMDDQRVAKATCKSCPVRMACLESKLEAELGKSMSQREKILYGGVTGAGRWRLQRNRDVVKAHKTRPESSAVK